MLHDVVTYYLLAMLQGAMMHQVTFLCYGSKILWLEQ